MMHLPEAGAVFMLNHDPIGYIFVLTSYLPKVSHVANEIARVFKKKKKNHSQQIFGLYAHITLLHQNLRHKVENELQGLLNSLLPLVSSTLLSKNSLVEYFPQRSHLRCHIIEVYTRKVYGENRE